MSRNGDGLYKRGSVYHFKYRDRAGKYHERSTKKRRLEEARAVRNRELQEFENNQFPTEMRTWTLGRASREWLDYRKVTVSPKSYSGERRLLRQVEKVFGPDRRLETFTEGDLRYYQVTRRATVSRLGQPVGPRTVNLELFTLIQILKQAKLWNRLKDGYRRLRVPRSGVGYALTQDEAIRLVRAGMSRPEWEEILWIAILAKSAGPRSCEIRRLQLGATHLELAIPEIEVRRESTKSDAGARRYPLNDLALWAVRKLMARAALLGAHRPEHYLLPKNLSKHTRPDDPNRGRKGFDANQPQTSWSAAWRSLRRAAGLPKLRFYDFRHSFITDGGEAGVPLQVMQDLVGHMSPEMTRHYTHIHNQAKLKAVRAIQEQHPELLKLVAAESNEQLLLEE